MNLLISDVWPAEAALDRVIPQLDDLVEYFVSPAIDDERGEHEGRIVSSREPSWYELRLSALRQLIMGTD